MAPVTVMAFAEECQRGAEFGLMGRGRRERLACGDRRPGLMQARDTGRGSAGMGEDAAAAHEEEIAVRHHGRRLRQRSRPLAGGEGRHDDVVRIGGVGERPQAVMRPVDHFGIGLGEFPVEAVHMHVVDAGEAPQRLIRLEVHAERGMAREHAEAVAMAVDDEAGALAQRLDTGEPGPVEADHHRRAALALDEVGMAQHRLVFVGDVEGDHDRLAGAVLPSAHLPHDRRHALGDRRVLGIAAAFVVLDEVDAGRAELGRRVGRSHLRSGPTLGLMMVPISGRPVTCASARVPFTPWRGKAKRARNAAGSSTCSRRRPVVSPRS